MDPDTIPKYSKYLLIFGYMDYFGMKEWTVKSVFYDFLIGQVVIMQILFSVKGITRHMVPKTAVENIKNLIISCTEKGSQDNHLLLDNVKRLKSI